LPILLIGRSAFPGTSFADLGEDCDGPVEPVGEAMDHLETTSQDLEAANNNQSRQEM
jgi:hypothetical protein